MQMIQSQFLRYKLLNVSFKVGLPRLWQSLIRDFQLTIATKVACLPKHGKLPKLLSTYYQS